MTSRDRVIGFAAGAMFAVGLALSGTTAPRVVLDGFRFDTSWDPRLWLMFVGSQMIAMPATRWLARRGRTLAGVPLQIRPRRPIDRRLVLGAVVFGVGWGLGGICPGPSFTTVASGQLHAAIAFAGIWAGIVLHDANRFCVPDQPPSRERNRHEYV